MAAMVQYYAVACERVNNNNPNTTKNIVILDLWLVWLRSLLRTVAAQSTITSPNATVQSTITSPNATDVHGESVAVVLQGGALEGEVDPHRPSLQLVAPHWLPEP